MRVGDYLDGFHFRVRKNKWLGYFAVFCRIALAAGFIPSGMQKVLGERFTVLPIDHPMGHFLDAFFQTGYYYSFVGILQVLSAVLLLIPRTVTLGAIIYFPIILNITILSLAVRFDGSQITSPLMTCAVLYLLCWDYHKFRDVFPFNRQRAALSLPKKDELDQQFPIRFFTGVFIVILLVVLHTRIFYSILPRNTYSDCLTQCEESDDRCVTFCECIHKEGLSLEECLREFEEAE
jgi:uncharacterized membrane protein YphA (DoxX/SURF4 family)